MVFFAKVFELAAPWNLPTGFFGIIIRKKYIKINLVIRLHICTLVSVMNNHTTVSPTALTLATALSEHKGEWMTAEWESVSKPASAHNAKVLTKRCTATVRTGVSFANLKVVRDAIEAGERDEVSSLPWGEWAIYPFIITHKGEEYVRLTLAGSSNLTVAYFVDGVQVERDAFTALLTPSSAKGGERPEVITVKMKNIIRLG